MLVIQLNQEAEKMKGTGRGKLFQSAAGEIKQLRQENERLKAQQSEVASESGFTFTADELKKRDEQITRQVMTYAHARYTSGYIESVKTNSDVEVQACVDHLSKGEGDE